MDEDEQTDFLIPHLTLGHNVAFGGTCISFHGGNALEYFSLLCGLPDHFRSNGDILASAASAMLT
eukprot:scaffold36774_cov366-Skeletonema_dohrnii-CCMP3373.AAC.1